MYAPKTPEIGFKGLKEERKCHLLYILNIVSKETLIIGNERQILQLKQAMPEIPSKVVILCFFRLINTLHLD